MLLTFLRGKRCVSLLLLTLTVTSLLADPLSKRTEIDFFRDVPSRNLKGFAARSDGRLVAGPLLAELEGTAPADLLWCLTATPDPAKWLVGSGPDGKIFEVSIDPANNRFTSRDVVALDEPHVFALARLPDGSLLAGTSPNGALCLIRDGKLVARVALPVDSIFDILLLNQGGNAPRALIATGNPGRIYQVDLAKFAQAPVTAEKITDAKVLEERGITRFGEIRDRNVRRLAQLNDGRVVAGSAPKGNVYAFGKDGGAPVILQENRDAEVTDLLPSADGGLYATLTFSGGSNEARITPPKGGKDVPDTLALMSAAPDRFGGRSSLVWFPPNGFPEVLTSRNGTAFYRMVRQGELLLLTGGEQGDMLGFDIIQRVALTFAGSASAQLNGLAAIPGQAGKYIVLRNNAPGFALLDFATAAPREAETRRIDLGTPAQLGAVRFSRLRELADAQVSVEAKTSNGSDDIEGWSAWTPLTATEGGWSTPGLRGRYVKFRFKLPASASLDAEIGKAAVYALPQNRRPLLQDFNLLSSNYGIVPAAESVPPTVVSVGQLLQTANPKDDDNKRKSSFLGSQIVPSPGAQVVIWNVNDPDGDALRYTFSIRRDGEAAWTDVSLNSTESYAQFDTSHLSDGIYFTRLVVTEAEPRPTADRLTTTFETDDLLVDHTPPEISESSARREGDRLVITIRGRDRASLLDGIEAVFNTGVRQQTEETADGVRDGREETFVLNVPFGGVASATSAEVTLYDSSGNSSTRRLSW